jgi:hypothetical protein
MFAADRSAEAHAEGLYISVRAVMEVDLRIVVQLPRVAAAG